MEERYVVTVSGMFNTDYAVKDIEQVSGGLKPIPYDSFLDLDWSAANDLLNVLEGAYPVYSFKIVQVQGWYPKPRSDSRCPVGGQRGTVL